MANLVTLSRLLLLLLVVWLFYLPPSPWEFANFFLITTIPWMIKPVYGLVSDFIPLFGRRRKSYFVLTTVLSAAGGAWLAILSEHKFWGLAIFFTAMGLGLAFLEPKSGRIGPKPSVRNSYST